MNILRKFVFTIKKPLFVLVIGDNRFDAVHAMRFLLSFHLKNKDAVIIESNLSDIKEENKHNFYLKKSQLPVLVVTGIKDRKEFFTIKKIIKILPKNNFLILNFDDDNVKKLLTEIHSEFYNSILTYGFQKKADIVASDVNISENGTNFKISIEGNTIPFWSKDLLKKKNIYSIMAAISLGKIKKINLVDIFQTLQKFKFKPENNKQK